jgi:hypothetical protein
VMTLPMVGWHPPYGSLRAAAVSGGVCAVKSVAVK